MSWLLPASTPEEMVSRVSTAFTATWGRQPAVISAAPGRVNLIGEHTDYNRGLCLPLALPQAAYVAAGPRADSVVRISSAQAEPPWTGTLAECAPGSVSGWPAYVAGVLWALGEAGWAVPGLDLSIDSAVPLGAGLSSSASIECAAGAAVAALTGRDLGKPAVAEALVRAGIRAEVEVVGAPTGGMDQTISVRATTGSALLLDFDDGTVAPVPLDLEAEGLALMVVDTGTTHALADGRYASRRASCEAAADLLRVPSLRQATLPEVEGLADPQLRRRARHVVTENARVRSAVHALTDARPASIGPLLSASHASLRDDYEVSCPELDLVVATANSHGALGARMTGGGFGGSVLALVPETLIGNATEAISAAAVRASYPEPRFLRARASSGARVLAGG